MNCIVISHYNIYDFINIDYIIYLLSLKYIRVYILLSSNTFIFCQNYFKQLSNIFYIQIPNNIDITTDNYDSIIIDYFQNKQIQIKNNKNYSLIKFGSFNPSWNNLKDTILIDNMNINYFEIFYEQYNLKYYKPITNEKWMVRDYKLENKYYQKIYSFYPEGYIFTYDVDLQNIKNINNKKNLIYEYSDNIKDESNDNWSIIYLLKIIENAKELHIGELNLLLLCTTIDLSHISKKYMYSKKIFLKKYFPSLRDWIFIYK